jgi:glycosyltransferase involved in cell wall biosynthesis
LDERIRVVEFADLVNAQDFIDTIVRGADPERFEVGVCVRSEESNIATPVYGDDTRRWLIPGTARSDWPRTAWRLSRLLREWDAHILHTHHYDQAVIGWMATRLYKRTRLVVGRHYSDAIYRSSTGVRRRALLALEQKVNRAARRIIVPSSMIREILVRRQGIDARKIDLIHYGFAPEKYTTPQESEVRKLRAELASGGDFLLATFARLHEEKGHRYLVEAMSELKREVPGIRWLIVGEGPERASIERQIGEAGLTDVVQLLGWRRDAMTIMAAADIVVQPTLQEAFSQTMVEALWMATPLVITDVSGAPDIITSEENGMLVPRGDSAALGRAVLRLARDPSLRARLAAAGRAYVEERLSIERNIKLYQEAFLRAMSDDDAARASAPSRDKL